MSAVTIFIRSLLNSNVLKKSTRMGLSLCFNRRRYADTPKADSSSTKLVVVQGTENEGKVRVRRAHVSDMPRILRFTRENARLMYPALSSSPGALHIVLGDYVSRALAQGHTLLAEQQNAQRWSQIRGLALSMAVCPWDAALLEGWARCVRCARSRQLISFAAHCLHDPALHHKYRVKKILQVILIVPRAASKTSEIVHMLAKSAIHRGREAGFPLIRFDVYNDYISQSLEELHMNKEWQVSYDTLPDMIRGRRVKSMNIESESKKSDGGKGGFVRVYTASTETK